MPDNTAAQFDKKIEACRYVFEKKLKDYGASWRILRPSSLTDQIYIKALRIRTLEENKEQKIGDSIKDEFSGIINYCVIGLIQLELGTDLKGKLSAEESMQLYDIQVKLTKDLLLQKNHDYGEAWRKMRPSSFTDLILVKLLRIKQIEENDGQTTISEGIDSNYRDILNYAIFALIKLDE